LSPSPFHGEGDIGGEVKQGGVTMLKPLKVVLGVAMLMLFVGSAFAQTVDTAWVRTYNGPGNDDDRAWAIAVDDSGCIYVTGYCEGTGGNWDLAIIKYLPNGDTAWARTYNGSGNLVDWARAVAIDTSYNVYVTGKSYGSGTGYDYVTIKYTSEGDTVWLRGYNGPGNSTDDANAIAVSDSGYVYVTGSSSGSGTSTDYATIKYDPDGDTIWVRRFNGPEDYIDYASAMALDGQQNIYVTGSSYDTAGHLDYLTIKYAPNGDTLWMRRYKGPGEAYDEACAIAVDSIGNAYVTGYSTGSGTLQDYATIRYYPNGDTAWVRRYNGPADSSDYARDIVIDDSGFVYVTGYSDSTGTYQDCLTIKYDSSGNEVWMRRYDYGVSGTDQPNDLAIDGSGNVYVAGYSGSGGTAGLDYATIKYHSNGDTVWVMRYNGPASGSDYAQALAVDDSGNVYVTGYSEGSGTGDDYCTIKYFQTASGVKDETGGRERPSEFDLSQNYPNPFNPSTKIEFTLAKSDFVTLQIYDVLGRKVRILVSEELSSGYKSVIWDGKNDDGKDVASGVYFYQLKVGDFSEPKKMLLLK
jgi:uncharacterized delta-60 repeat protein